MTTRPTLDLTRRAFATGLTGSLAALGAGEGRAAVRGAADALSPSLYDAALRGLARAGDSGDSVLAARADAALAALDISDPEAAAIVRIYRAHDTASQAWRYGDRRGGNVAEETLAALHEAIAACRPVSFHYVDLDGEVTDRTVLPLALVHPPQGIKLVAWCALREDYRQFFVRTIGDLRREMGAFQDRRLALLQDYSEGLAISAPPGQ